MPDESLIVMIVNPLKKVQSFRQQARVLDNIIRLHLGSTESCKTLEQNFLPNRHS